MPRDVTVPAPHPGVASVELDDNVPVGLDLLDVTALRVGRIGDGAVPGAGAGGQDIHVEPVEMDGVAKQPGLVWAIH